MTLWRLRTPGDLIAPPAGKRLENPEIRPLTGIRGFAALAVVLFHFHDGWIQLVPALEVLRPLALRGHMGVDLFFILSGFILCYIHKPGEGRLGLREYTRFLALRLARVYPNHLATLALLGLMVSSSSVLRIPINGHEYDFKDLPQQLTLTHAWPLMEGRTGFYWNYPSWSISCEWFAYLAIFPICWFALRRPRSPLMFLSLTYLALVAWLVLSTSSKCQSLGNLPEVTLEFIAGAALFRVWSLWPELGRSCGRALPWLLLLLLFIPMASPLNSRFALPGLLLLFPLLLLGLTTEDSWPAQALSTRFGLWLGNISYAIYMCHALLQKVIKSACPAEHLVHASPAVRLAIVLAQLGAVLGCSAALYYLVELPSRNRLRGVIRRVWSKT